MGPVRAVVPNAVGSDVKSTRATSCSEMGTLRRFFMDKLAEVRASMDDLSGTEVLAVNLKTENMKYQYQFSDTCTDFVNRSEIKGRQEIPRKACIGLASQDDPISGGLLANYDTTNLTLYQEEVKIQDNIQTINDTIALIGCDLSGFSFSADTDIGTIDTEGLRAKLNELSPYYISPGTLDFVTTYLVGNGILDTALFSSSEILKSVNSSLRYIKTVADKQF